MGAAQLLEALIVVHTECLAHALFAIHLVDYVIVHAVSIREMRSFEPPYSAVIRGMAAKKKTTRKKTTGKKTATRKTAARKTTARKTTTRKYSKKAGRKVERAMKEMKSGKLRSGRSGAKVTSRKQAIAIGLSEARAEGDKVPEKSG